MAESVRIRVFDTEIESWLREPWLRDRLLHITRAKVVYRARSLAPVQSGGRSHGGWLTIHAEPREDEHGVLVDVSWDTEHSYMRFPDLGTRRGVKATHFLERALHESETGV